MITYITICLLSISWLLCFSVLTSRKPAAMKKWKAILFGTLLTMSLCTFTACGTEGNNADETVDEKDKDEKDKKKDTNENTATDNEIMEDETDNDGVMDNGGIIEDSGTDNNEMAGGNEVEEYMHLEGTELPDWDDVYEDSNDSNAGIRNTSASGRTGQEKYTQSTNYGIANTRREKYTSMYGSYEEEKELKAIFEKTFGPVKSKKYNNNSRSFGNLESGSSFSTSAGRRASDSGLPAKTSHGAWKNNSPAIHRDDYLLVDGCNIIFAWEDLRDLAQADFHAAQSKLMDILSDYQGIKGCILILVFDAYRVEGHPEETFQYHNIHVVYTKEAETADQYIERTVHKIGRKHNVTVATSDGLEQIIIMGQGAARISARGFKEEIASAKQQMREEWQEHRDLSKNYLFDSMTEELRSHMEDIRLGRKKKEEL